MLKRIWRFFYRSFAVLGFFSFLSTLALVLFVLTFRPEKPTVPDRAVLRLDFAEGVTESPGDDPFQRLLAPEAIDLLTLTEAIRSAAKDDRIKGIIADLSFAELGLAETQEIRQAVLEFRKTGKFTIAYTDTFSEGGGSTGSYYLASAFEQIWMQPSGMIALTGIAAEVPFVKAALDRLGIQPEFVQRLEYKDAMDTFTKTGMTDAQRLTLESLLGSLYRQVAADIGRDRKLAQPAEEVLKDGPYLAVDAENLRLVDRLGYADQLRADVLERLYGKDGAAQILKQDKEPDHVWLSAAEYHGLSRNEAVVAAVADKPAIGVIYLDGTIMRSKDDPSLSSQGGVAAPQPIVDAFDAAIKSERIKAIVLRINSPGGSYVASDTMRRAVVRAREAGKPVFISMGGLAASGGYFVGMEGDRVFANPASLVGSIGVFGGKLALQDLYGKLNVNWGQVAIGDKALMWSSNTPFNDTTRAAFERSIDFVFEDFSGKARAARKLKEAEWPGLIGGRVLTGADGLQAGLVDELGTFRDTLNAARAAVKLTPENSVNLIVYPKQLTPIEAIREAFEGGQFMQAISMLALFADARGTFAAIAAPFAPRQVMEMPNVRLQY